MIRIGHSLPESIHPRPFPTEDDADRPEEDGEIESKGPVIHIPDVQ
jgi:hypothetical protein